LHLVGRALSWVSVRRVLSALVVLAILAPQAALAGEWVFCRYAQVTRDSCCCPVRGDGERRVDREDAPGPELRPSPCCDVVRGEPRYDVARVEPTARPTSITVVAAIEPIAPPPEARVAAVAGWATAPPSVRPDPIYLRHASLLL
jgi:hypothetical protein